MLQKLLVVHSSKVNPMWSYSQHMQHLGGNFNIFLPGAFIIPIALSLNKVQQAQCLKL